MNHQSAIRRRGGCDDDEDHNQRTNCRRNVESSCKPLHLHLPTHLVCEERRQPDVGCNRVSFPTWTVLVDLANGAADCRRNRPQIPIICTPGGTVATAQGPERVPAVTMVALGGMVVVGSGSCYPSIMCDLRRFAAC